MLGLVSGVRDYADLTLDQYARRDVYAVLMPGRLVSRWSVYSGAIYRAALSFAHDGRNLDVVDVRSLLDVGLTRVEALADIVAGTWFYDPDVASGTARWGDGVTRWGDGVTRWGQFPRLYLQLEDSSDPRLTRVMVSFGMHVSGRSGAGAVHPNLGPDKLAGEGGFETWGAGVPTGWTFASSGSYTVNEEATSVRAGARSARIAGSGAGHGELHRTPATADGAYYRLSGAYLLDVAAGARAVLLAGAASDFLYNDGRNHDASGQTILSGTGLEWRRFSFDFAAFDTSTLIKLRLECDAGVAANLHLDDVKLQRIYRYEFFEPRLKTGGAGSIRAGKNDVFFGGQRISSAALSFINADGWLGAAGSDLDWTGRRVQIYVGGRSSDSEAIPRENWRQRFEGTIQRPAATDAEVSLELEDVRSAQHRKLPPDPYNTQYGYPMLDQRYEGTRRPLLIGTKTNITPIRTSKTGDYGVYDVADCARGVNGIKQIDAVYAYTDAESATQKLADRRITLAEGTDWSADLPNGRITILRDVGPFQILAGVDVLDRQRLGAVRGNDRLDFSDGSVRVASLTPGLYSGAGLASHIQTQMNAVSSGWTVTYSESTHLFTVTKSSGTAQLLLGTGANKDRTVFGTLGFTGSSDLTGALTYTANDAVFTGPDENHVLRVNAKGYKDDASGTYTGTANALIEKGPDVVRFIWRKLMGQPLSKVDSASFVAARTTAPEQLGIYVLEELSTADLLARIERSCQAEIVMDGDGTIYFDPYSNDAPAASAPHVRDHDFLGIPAESRGVADVHGSIRVRYDQDPSTGGWLERTAPNVDAEARFDRAEPRDFETVLISGEDAQVRANECATLSLANPLRLRADVLGLLSEARPGQKARVTRSRSTFNTDRAFDAEVFRILGLDHDPMTGRFSADLVKDVAL